MARSRWAGSERVWQLLIELEQGQDFRAQNEVVKSLNACVRHADDWICQAVHRADPATEPIYRLAELLHDIENGRKLWSELKDFFFEKIDARHERSIVQCLEQFRDDEHTDWLKARVSRKDDFLGAAARRALFVLQPGRAPSLSIDTLGFRSAPQWWLLPHLNASPVEGEAFINRAVQEGEDPWRVVWNLSGFEDRVSPETLNDLLAATSSQLEKTLDEPYNENEDPLRVPSFFLGKIHRVTLLDCFQDRRGTDLDHLLGRWLCERGAHDEGWTLSGKRLLRVMKRIGGEGITRVAHHLLSQQDLWEEDIWWLTADAIDLAVMRPDEETADLLLEAALHAAPEGQFPSAQNAAIGALAAIGRVDLALRGVVNLGLQIWKPVVSLILEHRPADQALQPVLDALEAPEGPLPGAVFALGLAQRKDLQPRLHAILQEAPRGSEISRACLLALRYIDAHSPSTIEALTDNLSLPENEAAAWTSLFEIQTPEALQALIEHLKRLFAQRSNASAEGSTIAMNLLRLPQTRRDVAEFLWTKTEHDLIPDLALGALQGFAELERPDVDAWLGELMFHEERTFRHGTQVGAIRALSSRQPRRAFDAAQRLLAPDSPDRDRSPSLLLEIDAERALPILREQLAEENSVLMIMTIGEALHLAERAASLIAWLDAPSTDLHHSTCIAAELLPWTDELAEVLRRRLYDESWVVRNAANQTLDRIWHTRELACLVDEISQESDTTRRWCLLDILLEAAHPGLSGPYRRQPWLKRLGNDLPLAMHQRIDDRLEKRRKEVLRELEKRQQRNH